MFTLLQLDMSNAFSEIAKRLCKFDLKMLRTTKHLLANDLVGTVDIDDLPSDGVLHRRAGAVVYVLHCTPVNVTVRETSICSQVLVWHVYKLSYSKNGASSG